MRLGDLKDRIICTFFGFLEFNLSKKRNQPAARYGGDEPEHLGGLWDWPRPLERDAIRDGTNTANEPPLIQYRFSNLFCLAKWEFQPELFTYGLSQISVSLF